MKDLRFARGSVLEALREERAKDRWGWHLTGLSKGEIRIGWKYLDWLGEKKDFGITIHEDCDEMWLMAKMPDCIDENPVITIGDSRWDDAKTIEDGAAAMVHRVAMLARARW